MHYVLTVAAVLLTACTGVPGFGQPPAVLAVAGRSVIIAGPAGYCVDRSATRDSTEGVFVLLGSCASIGNSARLSAPSVAGVLTASVSIETGTDITGALPRLEAFFKSTPGRRALARDSNPASVTVLATAIADGVFTMKVRDTSPNAVSGLQPEYWRALFDIRGRIVALSVNSFQRRPMPDATGRATLAAFVARTRAENSALVDPVPDPV